MYFDIGANIGKWSLANIHNCNKIIAIEASPSTYITLLNTVTHHTNKILCINNAVCNSEKEYVDFYECECNTISTLNKEWLTSKESRFYNSKYNIIKCKTVTLDKLIEKYGIPELIKIDVEGGEFESISSLTKKVNSLCFEWASETNNITFQCIDYLHNLGYTDFSIQYEDNYLYRPSIYTDITTIKNELINTKPKHDWGMIWVK